MSESSLNKAFFEFIAALIVLSFAFRVAIMLAGPPLKILLTVFLVPVSGGRFDRASYRAALFNPLLLALLYGAFIALVTLRYSGAALRTEQNLYLGFGAAAAAFSLLSYSAGLLAKVSTHLLGDDSENRAHRIAATASFLTGLAAFGVFYYYPGYVMAIPGADLFFGKVFELAAWLQGYKLVQIILVISVSGYFLAATVGKVFGLLLAGLKMLKNRLCRQSGP